MIIMRIKVTYGLGSGPIILTQLGAKYDNESDNQSR